MNKIPLLDHDSKVPLHRQAEEQLRKLIEKDHFKEGDLLPNEIDLARRWGISRNTLRQAFSNMVKDGLLERKKRSGTQVKKKMVKTDLANWLSFTQEMKVQGVPFRDITNHVVIVNASKDVANRLGIKEKTPVVKLERIRSTGRKPMVCFESYFHPRVGLTGNENFKKPLYEMLDEEYHIVPVYSQEEIKAIAATEKMARLLEVAKGSVVLERKRLVLDAGRKPIEYNVCYYRGDWFTYSIEIKRQL